MNTSGKDKFLIDGFPRNDENRAAFEVPLADLSFRPASGSMLSGRWHGPAIRDSRTCRPLTLWTSA